MEQTDILIIGQGPYGLALANYLSEKDLTFRIIGKPMELWRQHTFSHADLRSDRATSEIAHPRQLFTLRRFREEQGSPRGNIAERISVKEYRCYIDWVYQQLPFEPQDDYVAKLFCRQGRYLAELEQGDAILARRVVVATGVAHHLHVPAELKAARKVTHSYHTRRIEALRHKKILVVGSGQSAAEALEIGLKNHNELHWYTRTTPRFYSEPLDLPKWIFDLVVKSTGIFRRLSPAIIRRLFAVFSATTITPEYEARLADVKRFQRLPELSSYDHVIAATGYRYGLKQMNFLAESLRNELAVQADMPQIDKHFMSSKKGLYFIGPATEAFFGPPVKFMIGSRYVAPHLSQILTR